MNTTEYEKLRSKIRGMLEGMNCISETTCWDDVLRLFNFASSVHIGKRKGGQPEFSHQLNMAAYALSLFVPSKFLREEDVAKIVALILIHDIPEDYHTEFVAFLSEVGIEEQDNVYFMSEDDAFLSEVLNLSMLLNRYTWGTSQKMTNDCYYERVGSDVFTSITKVIDRIHNLSTMLGVMKHNRIVEYIEETDKYVFKLIKCASREYPSLSQHMESLKSTLSLLMQPIRVAVATAERNFETPIPVSEINTGAPA